jgi:hypothetical protein
LNKSSVFSEKHISGVVYHYRDLCKKEDAGISTIEEANRFLLETDLLRMNEKFSRPAFDPADAHVPLGNINLTETLCFEYDRVVD